MSAKTWQNPPFEFIEQLPLAAYACDASGRIIWFNTRATELWGRSPKIGDNGELNCGFDGSTAEVLRTGMPLRGVESRVERPDGTNIWAVVYIAPIHDEDGNLAGAINCFHERVAEALDARAGDWVQSRDARLVATYEHVGAGIVEVDQDGRILRVNQQLCALTGYSAAELLGRTIFQETLPEDVDADQQQFQRQLTGEIDRYSIEKRIYRKTGEHFWAEVASSSVRDAAGKFLYAVRVQHDISNRKLAEEELARRMDEQAALFQFSERIQDITEIREIYDAVA